MKTGRIVAYALGGIIVGLLLENSSLRLRQKASKKMNDLKKKVGEIEDTVKGR